MAEPVKDPETIIREFCACWPERNVDKLLEDYATADDAGQVADIKKIEAAMLKDIPVIPTTESVDWFQYNTADLGGWPTEQDPYAQPAAYAIPDVGQVLTHIYSKAAQK